MVGPLLETKLYRPRPRRAVVPTETCLATVVAVATTVNGARRTAAAAATAAVEAAVAGKVAAQKSTSHVMALCHLGRAASGSRVTVHGRRRGPDTSAASPSKRRRAPVALSLALEPTRDDKHDDAVGGS